MIVFLVISPAHLYILFDSPTSTTAQRGLISYIFELFKSLEFRIWLCVAVDLLEMLRYTKNALDASGLKSLHVAVAIKNVEHVICDSCQRGSVLCSALADSTADALKGHRGPSHVERLLRQMHSSGGKVLHLKFTRVSKDGLEAEAGRDFNLRILRDKQKLKVIFQRVRDFAGAVLDSMKARFPSQPVLEAMSHCCRSSASTAPGISLCMCMCMCVCVCVCIDV